MKPKVLIVDDDPLMHMLYSRHLEIAGYRMLVAKNGQEAILLAAREFPQLIVMDILMPSMDGLSALRELRKGDETKNIPVLIVTATVAALAATKKETSNAGASGFLAKPFSPAQLLKEVRRLAPVSAA
jgi:CheY-like chemotaxis protein